MKLRLLLFLSATLIIVALYFLPNVVLINQEEEVTNQQKDASPDETIPQEQHNTKMPEAISSIANDLKNQINSLDSVNFRTFADSLAEIYLQYQKLDSSAKYFELAYASGDVEDMKAIGDRYYEAFQFAIEKEKANYLAEKTREYYNKVLQGNPDNLEIRTNMAMTYLSSDNPMQGIMMLREVIEKDPDNVQALFNLGILSYQTGQYDKAIERFENILEVDSSMTEAKFYLALAMDKQGKGDVARKMLQDIKENSDDPALKATIDSYLQEM